MEGAITPDEFRNRLMALCVKSGMTGLPRKQRDRQIILKSVVLTLDRTTEYTVAEINGKLAAWLQDVGGAITLDHVELRRRLVDEEYLGRSPGGFRYWVAVSSRKHLPFDAKIEGMDIPDLIRAGCEDIQAKKRKYLRR